MKAIEGDTEEKKILNPKFLGASFIVPRNKGSIISTKLPLSNSLLIYLSVNLSTI